MFREKVAGKVVLITGASSGIGEHVAYEYARRGACLAFVARRKNLLQEVADRARYLESPDVIVIPADVSKVEDCKRFVDETVNHFARLDHLVNNAGIANMNMFEEADDIKKLAPVMETNFWGSVNSTYFALPHLRKSRGKVLVTASAAGWLTAPRLSFYSASKAAVIIFFETLRIELGSDVGITTVSPGLTESEITRGKFLSKEAITVLDQDMRDVRFSLSCCSVCYKLKNKPISFDYFESSGTNHDPSNTTGGAMCRGDREKCMSRRQILDHTNLDRSNIAAEGILPRGLRLVQQEFLINKARNSTNRSNRQEDPRYHSG
ncbi:hypothetical protein Drorol1_Dr00012547 [Drosera rotundifolia]